MSLQLINFGIMRRDRKTPEATFKLWALGSNTWLGALDTCRELESGNPGAEFVPVSEQAPHDPNAPGLGFMPQWVLA